MGVFFDIDSALQTKLNTVADAPFILWENTGNSGEAYTPEIGTRWWRPTNMPAHSQLATVGGVQKHQGIYQVDAFVPLNEGLDVLMQDLDNIYSAFNTTLSLYAGDSRIDILSIGKGKVTREESWCHGYIEIYYMCYSH